MTVLVIADDEVLLKSLPQTPAQVLVSCGDLPDESILRAAKLCRAEHALAVKGNHDSSGRFSPPIVDLHLRCVTIGNTTFGGLCGAWKYKQRGNYLFEQWEVDTALSQFAPVDVFVTHNSPLGVHNRDDHVHQGFSAFNDYLNRCRPKWHLHGHQHLNIESTVGATRVVGTYGFRYIVIPGSEHADNG